MDNERKAKQVFEARLEERRRQGRPRKNGKIIQKRYQEIEEYNKSLKKMAQDRDQYKEKENGPTLKGNRAI